MRYRFFLVFIFSVSSAHATMPDERLVNPVAEQRALELTRGLRCMVCQNQSIEDSDAPLAKDLRILVREQVAAGKSDDEIHNYLVARYGDFILLRPALKPETYLLWGMPLLILAAGLLAVLRWLRNQHHQEN